MEVLPVRGSEVRLGRGATLPLGSGDDPAGRSETPPGAATRRMMAAQPPFARESGGDYDDRSETPRRLRIATPRRDAYRTSVDRRGGSAVVGASRSVASEHLVVDVVLEDPERAAKHRPDLVHHLGKPDDVVPWTAQGADHLPDPGGIDSAHSPLPARGRLGRSGDGVVHLHVGGGPGESVQLVPEHELLGDSGRVEEALFCRIPGVAREL